MKTKIRLKYKTKEKSNPEMCEELAQKIVKKTYGENEIFDKNTELAKVRELVRSYVDRKLREDNYFSRNLLYADSITFEYEKKSPVNYEIYNYIFAGRTYN
jgi:hypothetical protein